MAVGKILSERSIKIITLQGLRIKNNRFSPFNIGTNVEWVVGILGKSYQLGYIMIARLSNLLKFKGFGSGFVVGKKNQSWVILHG